MPVKTIHNEKELLSRISTGDERAFAELFDIYQPNIYTTALRMTGSEWTAEEILQDTFLKVWLKRHTLGDIDNFGGWIYTIAENYTFNALKRAGREQQRSRGLTHEILPVSVEGTDHSLLEKQYESILRAAVGHLPEKQKQTYRLIKQQGLKREEAARELAVSPETVKYNLEQAMRSIRAYCLAQLDGHPGLLLFILLVRNIF